MHLCFGYLFRFNSQLIVLNLQVLSDDEKRSIYDRYGEDGLKGGPSMGVRQFLFHLCYLSVLLELSW